MAGRYRLLSQLGRGGMGLVWLAHDELLHQRVALKQVVPSGLEPADTQANARARAEARAAARVDHAGVIRIHDMVEDDGLVWVAMELLSGRTLREALQAEGRLPVGAVTRVGLALLGALRATHHQEIVHRDVKPANVFLCDDGRVVLIDFGIAYALDDTSHVPDGDFVGSPAYVAPELVRGREVAPESDLFSLGATLFAAVEGEQPFPGNSIFDTIVGVLEDAPGPFRHAGPLRPVIEGLLAKDPEQRISAEAATAALESIQARLGTTQRPVERPGTRSHWLRRDEVPLETRLLRTSRSRRDVPLAPGTSFGPHGPRRFWRGSYRCLPARGRRSVDPRPHGVKHSERLWNKGFRRRSAVGGRCLAGPMTEAADHDAGLDDLSPDALLDALARRRRGPPRATATSS